MKRFLFWVYAQFICEEHCCRCTYTASYSHNFLLIFSEICVQKGVENMRHEICPGLTRRSLLRYAAWISAASAFPRLTMAFAQDVSPVMEKLSAYMAEARNRPLPENVVRE